MPQPEEEYRTELWRRVSSVVDRSVSDRRRLCATTGRDRVRGLRALSPPVAAAPGSPFLEGGLYCFALIFTWYPPVDSVLYWLGTICKYSLPSRPGVPS